MIPSGKPTRFYSSRQEKLVAKSVNGKVVPNSGAIRFGAGDVSTSHVLIECKTCTKAKKSFTVKKEWIEKNQEEAFAMGKLYSAVAIDFGEGENYYIISQKLFNKLVEVLDSN